MLSLSVRVVFHSTPTPITAGTPTTMVTTTIISQRNAVFILLPNGIAIILVERTPRHLL
jgi:hypothetical protein